MIRRLATLFVHLCCLVAITSCAEGGDGKAPAPHSTTMKNADTSVAILGGGCFWCIEAVYQRLDGVISVESGYAGGTVINPTYKQVCEGTTGHAEVCRVTFDPSVLSYADLLQVFFSAHDPTTLNRQGNDVGTQYRSIIMVADDEQRAVAAVYIAQLTEQKTWPDPIVTEVVPATTFYKAEDYHQNYFNENGAQPYCAFVVRPKVEKFLRNFGDRVKPGYR